MKIFVTFKLKESDEKGCRDVKQCKLWQVEAMKGMRKRIVRYESRVSSQVLTMMKRETCHC